MRFSIRNLVIKSFHKFMSPNSFHGLLMAMLLSSCISTQKQIDLSLPLIDPKLSELGLMPLVFVGRNSQIFLNSKTSNGVNIFYISSERTEHSHPQVRNFSGENSKDIRVSYQLGENASPVSFDEQNIVYLSNTDEIKEQIFAEASDPGNELYLHNVFTHHIERLTYLPGPTGPFAINPQGNIVFVQKTGSKYQLYQINKERFSYKKLIADLPKAQSWIGFREDDIFLLSQNGHSFTKFSNGRLTSVKEFPTSIFAPVPYEKGWIYSMPRANTILRELVYWNSQTDCLESMFSSPDFSFEEIQLSESKAILVVDGKVFSGPKPVIKKCL